MKKFNLIPRMIHKISFLQNFELNETKEPNWQIISKVHADVRPVFDNNFTQLENINFGNIITEEYFLFTIRYMNEINNKMRIDFYGQLFEIKRIINKDCRNKTMKIIGLEV